ncbi:hypothetical protein L249_6775 [Ophiocordyceps polyrhachis-furcata BCC 54312]|uniref:Uncharacterized protein n=1 Tax=Ophiocordyceps polyrhachis-furcata BCC 54312 TaxID=1330021 RepID=A0A367LMC1_9HYPO|nr:hypothetical protein L249_6775 [Ophiocordyceps polyrhachis-furcata BCC 54312]
MSLSRAFTTRRLRLSTADGGQTPRRSHSMLRHKISAPIELIHTTNMLSYNAPDIPRTSSLDTDSQESTPPTSPEVGSGSSSPHPNHLTLYFESPAKSMAVVEEEKPPQIPRRSPSHTKKNSFDAIARSRSASRLSSHSDLSFSTKAGQSFSRSSSTSTRASSISQVSATKQQASPPPAAATTTTTDGHPFGQELAKVKELAEEFSVDSRLPVIDEEQQYLDARGLIKLSADEYLGAIHSLASAFFPDSKHAMTTWI